MSRQQGPRADGFTLIELLVVIAIITMLASLMLPSLAGAMKRARSMGCLNNLRQLGLGVQSYLVSHDGLPALSGYFPSWGSPGAERAWTQRIVPYIGENTGLFIDPEQPDWMPMLPVDYYLNLLPAFVEVGSKASGTYVLNLELVSWPSAFILMSEDLHVSPQQEIDPTNETSDRTGFGKAGSNYPPPHNGFANFLFMDGHVSSAKEFNTGTMTYWYTQMADWQDSLPDPFP